MCAQFAYFTGRDAGTLGAERLVLREAMAAMEAQLDPEQFVRIHRSRIVRIAAVTDIETLASGQYVARGLGDAPGDRAVL